MSNEPPATALVTRAANGDKWAWDALVQRYAPLIWSICRRYQLGGDAEDVGQAVWLRLLEHLHEIREPAALAGWLATTTRRECGRALRAKRGPQAAGHMLDTESIPDEQTGMAEQELLAAERHAALREAFTRLPRPCQQLIALLTKDPPLPYAQISAQLGIPVGSIGPRRSRCLEKLRRDPALAALIDPDVAPVETKPHRQRCTEDQPPAGLTPPQILADQAPEPRTITAEPAILCRSATEKTPRK